MKQLRKTILIVMFLITCLFFNSISALAEESILNCSGILSYNSSGEQVKLLQKELNETMSCNLTVDGMFGTKTKECVRDFQKKYNLTVDGIVGSSTCGKLNTTYLEDNNSIEVEDNDSVEVNVYEEESTLNCRSLLSYNSRGEQVKMLQEELNETMSCNLTADGVFGAKTKECVRNFQKKYNLTVDGIVGAGTCGKLNTVYLEDNNYVVINVSDTGYLNVRAKATTNSTKVGTTTYGTVYKVYGSTVTNGTTWYKIKYNDEYAYISSDYVKKDAIVLNISSQTVKLYKDGKLTLDALVITGTNGKHDTPLGRYMLYTANKDLAVTLRGYNDDGSRYASYVDYWMPFITSRGIGFHDASWKTSSNFRNVNTYLTNGSHGCVNMQKADAKLLYNAITKNMYVYVVA